MNDQIKLSKQKYYDDLSSKLNNPLTSRKKYWTLLKTLINGKKVPTIPPLLVNNIYVSNFNEKANAFNTFFATQCSSIDTGSEISAELEQITSEDLFDINFSSVEISNIISNLNMNKARGYDNICIKIIKIFGKSICKPLVLIFRNSLAAGKFPQMWKYVGFLKLFSIQFIITSQRIIYFHLINLDLDLAIRVQINHFQLFTIYTHHLTTIVHLKQEGYF